mmetsp:Transcript_38007/g.119987  ORF Transcript_38007/g.119987 Transcript_38007/m.119987 type:complete len:193 (+) Transcript_38007:112-690(+)
MFFSTIVYFFFQLFEVSQVSFVSFSIQKGNAAGCCALPVANGWSHSIGISVFPQYNPNFRQDTVDAWVALRDLLGQVQAGRAQVILESIFAEDSVSRALAMGQALSNMDGGAEDVPASVLNKLKADLGGHIKSNYYTYRRAIEKEIALIDRLMEYKQRAFAIAGSAILALFIAIGNFCAFIFSRYVTGQWSP